MGTRHTAWVLLGWVVHVSIGCTSGQAYDFGGESDETCDETAVPLASVDAESDLGFAASDLLDWVEGEHQASFAWSSSESVDFSPSGTSTNAAFVIDCPEPMPRFIRSEPRGGMSSTDIGVGDTCPDRVRVSCELGVNSEDGGLDESWAVEIDAPRSNYAKLRRSLEPDGFSGSFEIGAVNIADTEVRQLSFEMHLSEYGVSGTLSSVLQRTHDGGVSATWTTYARFPEETCIGAGSGAFVVDDSSDAGNAAGAAIVDLLAPDVDRTIQWGDGEADELTLTVSPDAWGCVWFSTSADGFAAVYTANVDASTPDGRLNLSEEGRLTATLDQSGELASAYIGVTNAEPSSSEVAALLDTTVEDAEELASAYDGLAVDLVHTFEAGASRGHLRLVGATIPDCASNPPEGIEDGSSGGMSGCPGIDATLLFEANWTR